MRLLTPFLLAGALTQSTPATEIDHVCDVYPECRALTEGEITLARSVFGDIIDFESVSIINGRYLGIFPIGDEYTGMAPDGNIYAVKESVQSEDYSAVGAPQGFFIHEMTHVWQSAAGVNVIASGFGLHMNSGTASYQYALEEQTQFADLSIEQQAKIVENYFLWDRYLRRPVEEMDSQGQVVDLDFSCGQYTQHYEVAAQALTLPSPASICAR